MEDEYPHPLMLDPAQLMPYLRVNKRGLRFTAEYEAYNHLANAIQAQPGAFDYYIVDANCAEIVDKLWTPLLQLLRPQRSVDRRGHEPQRRDRRHAGGTGPQDGR